MAVDRPVSWFLVKTVVLSLPLLMLLVAYACWDPFFVVRKHAQYYPDPIGVSPNRDFVSTELLVAHGPTQHDSFIFGNSRSMAFETGDWSTHLNGGARPFHYDASLESLYGVWAKVRYLDRVGFPLRNALLVVDASLLEHSDYTDKRALYRKHPLISGDSWWDFHLSFFEAFLARLFFVKYAHFKLGHRWHGYMAGVLERRWTVQDPLSNDLSFRPREEEITRLGEGYYRLHAGEFDGPRPDVGTSSPPALNELGRKRLAELAEIFTRQGTNVQVVVSPLYDGRPLARADLTLLEDAFGKGRVHDVSGVNAITADRHNYYESSHYRIDVARQIMEKIYGPAARN